MANTFFEITTESTTGEFYGQTEEGSPYPEGVTVDSFMES